MAKKPMDLCKVCGAYAVGCKPVHLRKESPMYIEGYGGSVMKKPGMGKSLDPRPLRILQRDPSKRFCDRHMPEKIAARQATRAITMAAKQICRGLSPRMAPICIQPRRKKGDGCEIRLSRVEGVVCFGIRPGLRFERPRCSRKVHHG